MSDVCRRNYKFKAEKVTYGARDYKNGAVESVTEMFSLPFTHKPETEGGVLEEECSDMLSRFFKNLREKKQIIKSKR